MAPMESADGEGPLTLDSFNLGRIRSKTQSTFIGKIRAFNTLTKFEWVYLFVCIVGLLASFGLTLQRLFSGDLDSSDFTFAILLLSTIVFCMYYVIHAVLTERADELLVFVVTNVIVVIYCTVNYVSQPYHILKMVRLIVVWTFSPLLIGSSLWFCLKYCRSNNLLFNTVGSIAELQKICKMFYFCSSLLKLDLQLQLSMVILVMGNSGTDLDLEQKIILGVGVCLTVLFITIGFLGLMRESRSLMTVFYILGLLEPAYIVYKFYYASVYETKDNAVYESTFACGVFAFAVWLSLMICTGIFMSRYFDKGLKEKMFADPTRERSTSPSTSMPS